MKRTIYRMTLIIAAAAFVSGTALAVPSPGDFGNFYVSNSDLTEYDENGGFVGTLPGGTGLNLYGLTISQDLQYLYATDPTNSRIYEINAGTGAIVRTIQNTLMRPDQLRQPTYIDYSYGYLYVSDIQHNAVLQVALLPAPGTPFVSRNFTDNINNPTGLAWSTAGNLYIANNSNEITVLGSEFEYLRTMTFSTSNLDNVGGLAFDLAGNLYVVSTNTNSVLRVNPLTGSIEGVYGGGEQSPLNNPIDVAFSARGTLLVTDTSGVTEFYLSGDILGQYLIPGGATGIAAVTPEPATLLLTGLGLGLLALRQRRKKHTN